MQDSLPHLIVLALLLIVLFAMHRAREALNPLVKGIVGGLANHAQVNAPAYGMAIMFGLSASLAAFYDVFSQLAKSDLAAMSWHQYVACWAKIMNPFIVASLASATKGHFKQANQELVVPAKSP